MSHLNEPLAVIRKRRHTLTGIFTMDGRLHLSNQRTMAWHNEDEAFVIKFNPLPDRSESQAQKELADAIGRNGVKWIWFQDKRWFCDFDMMKRSHPNLTDFNWVRGNIEIIPKIVATDSGGTKIITFEITQEYMNETAPKRIFLSHKGVDKERVVRPYYRILGELGLDPWLDEEAMAAGSNLERALLKGMTDSCAAIFFITANYIDSGYLASEVDYAIREKRKKNDRFAIITLLLEGGSVAIPQLLEPYVWKTPRTEFEGLEAILQALPIRLPAPVWNR